MSKIKRRTLLIKTVLISLTLMVILASFGFSEKIPIEVSYESWNDNIIIVKTFEVSEYADPELLREDPFELIGNSF